MKNSIKRYSAEVLCKTGLFSLFELFSQRNLTILALHRVVTEDEWARSLYKPMMITVGQFESMLEMIKRYYHPITLSEAIKKIKAGEKFQPGTVVITFDDGYLDVYQHAYPLLKSFDIPATLYLTTGVIGKDDNYLWWDEVDYFYHTAGLDFPELDESFSEQLKTAVQLMEHLSDNIKEEVEARVRGILFSISIEERNRFVEKLRASVLAEEARPPLMLSWNEVSEMMDLIEMSNHTVSHRLLDELDAQDVGCEITKAQTRIEALTGKPCNGLAYPGGVFTSDVVDIARKSGVEYAVTTRFSNNSHKANLLTLDRKDVGYLYIDSKIYPAYFKVVMSSIMDWSRWISPDNPSWVSRPDIKHENTLVKQPPLIVHVIYHLAVGGLENGLVNLVNRLSEDHYRHAIICMTDYTDFRNRIQSPNVDVYVLNKQPGKDLMLYMRIWKLFRRLKPDIVHTRNLSTLETQLPAFLAGIPHRVHGEHGRDMDDIDGTSKKYQLLRRVFKPLIQEYIALSLNLQDYLREQIGVPERKLNHICNGVDTKKFRPAEVGAKNILPSGFVDNNTVVFGTVGRMQAVKDQITLARAFVYMVKMHPHGKERLRLLMIGDGELRKPVMEIIESAGFGKLVWLPGEREDVPELLRAIDVFVLPSLAEGISNTILEAMASGLPVVATDVGGNSELVEQGVTGYLVKRGDPVALASSMQKYVDDSGLQLQHGIKARKSCEDRFSINAMVTQYKNLYDSLIE